MKRFRFLLFDANIVIKLFELGIWQNVLEKCDILLARTVAENEAEFFFDPEGGQHGISFTEDVAANRIEIVDVELGELREFNAQFDPIYLEKLDPGEAESLAHMALSSDPCLICSSDAIVFRVLAQLERSDDGLSLEEVLGQIGLGRNLPPQYTKAFRDRWRKKGEEERIQGIGLKPGDASK